MRRKPLRSNLSARDSSLRRLLHDRGTVLIIVLWIALGLVSTALLFANSMLLEYRAAENSVAGLEAAQAIEGARRYVANLLANAEEPNMMPDIQSYEAEEVPVGDATFWLLGRGTENVNKNTKINSPAFSLVDEASKLNLNTATREMLEALPCITPELAGAIIDWRDTDDDVSPDGAESQNYLMLNPPYNCKNSNFETVEELHLLIGGELNVLYGEDANLNGFLDPNEDDGEVTLPSDNQDGRLEPGLFEYVTVYSREPNKQSDGSKRLNIKNDQGGQLASLLEEKLGQTRAGEIERAVGTNTQNINSLLEYYIRSKMTPDEFAQVADALCVSDDEYTTGLVNVNTASAEVLACIPGIGQDFAAQLLAYRQGKTVDELKTVAWVTNVLEEQTATQAGPYITTRTYQYSADVAAVGRGGRGFRRVLFVFDTSGGKPVVVYRRDRTRLGWALGPDIRSKLVATAEK